MGLTAAVTPSTKRVSLKQFGLSSSTCPRILSGTKKRKRNKREILRNLEVSVENGCNQNVE